LYDNLDDLKSKLQGTIIYYKGQACWVKDCGVNDVDETGVPTAYYLKLTNRKKNSMSVLLNDPDLNYMHFKLGYCNYDGYAVFIHRKPVKQYKQGLKGDQIDWKCATAPIHINFDFNFNSHICDMLEGVYPTAKYVADALKYQLSSNKAFHPNFAMSYDTVHEDYILEYKGVKVGFSQDLKNITLKEKFSYIREALVEAIGYV